MDGGAGEDECGRLPFLAEDMGSAEDTPDPSENRISSADPISSAAAEELPEC